MKIKDMTLENYMDILKSDSPAPGGGAVSALTGAQGAALVSMVCELTIPKEKYSKYRETCIAIRDDILKIYQKLVTGIDKDAEAFGSLSSALKMPKGSETEKAARNIAIQEATIAATEAPYEIMELCLSGLKITADAVGNSNPNVSSDLGVAALIFLAAVKSAYLNVKINLPGIKEQEIKRRFETVDGMIREAEALAEKIYTNVLGAL